MRTLERTLLSLTIAGMLAIPALAGSSINTTNKWAWSGGAGWINCRTDSTNGALIGEFYCSGYWYSPTAGWIHLGNGAPSNGVYYATNSATDYGVNHDGKGHLWGFAWCPSFGWISFSWTNNLDAPTAPKVDLKTGICSGYAWGGSLGWIGLSNLSAYLKTDWMSAGTNADSDGLPDSWEINEAGGTNVLSQSGDYDSDLVTDYGEYVAGTSPTNPADYLGVQGWALPPGSTNLQIEWSSKQTRLYKVEKKDDLLQGSWVDAGFGLISSDSETSTVKSLPLSTQGFFRVKAVLPLAQ